MPTFRLYLIACLVTFASLGTTGCGVDDIPRREEAARAAWSRVLNQYQRRADLIPNLVETVKGYAARERETLRAVAEARARATGIRASPDMLNDPRALEAFRNAQGHLSGALDRLLLIAERYPDLKANQNFLALRSQLEDAENRIVTARRGAIDAVRLYNTELRTFPGRLWAATLYADATPMVPFTVADEDAVARPPAVKF